MSERKVTFKYRDLFGVVHPYDSVVHPYDSFVHPYDSVGQPLKSEYVFEEDSIEANKKFIEDGFVITVPKDVLKNNE